MTLSNERDQRRIILGVLIIGTLLLYGQVVGFQFTIYDDDQYVANNPAVNAGLSPAGIKHAFGTTLMGNWHPVTVLSHMLDCSLFGLTPGLHHLVNVVLHTANAALIFLLLSRLTGAMWRSAAVAALFAWHPLHVESVAWVAERKDVLSLCFGLLSLLAYARYAMPQESGARTAESARSDAEALTDSALRAPRDGQFKGSHQNYGLALLFFALAVMSKPMLVSLPCLLLLLDFWPLRRLAPSAGNSRRASPLSLLKEKLPFFIIAALLSLLTYLFQKQWGAMGHVGRLSLHDRIGNALVSYCRYLAKTFWPLDLSVHYPHPGGWALGLVIGALLGLGLVTVVAVGGWRRWPWLTVGWLWFIGTLVPVIGLVQVGTQSMADRYVYLPHIGLFVALVWTGAELSRQRETPRKLGWAMLLISLVACGGLSWRQISHWRSSETLFARAVQVTPANPLAHYNYGVALGLAGKPEQMVEHYEETLRLDPNYFSANVNLGHYRYLSEDYTGATNYLGRAVQIIATNALPHFFLGCALEKLGDLTAAKTQLALAVAGETNSAEYRIAYSRVLHAAGETEAAIGQLEQALPLGQQLAFIHSRLGMLYTAQGKAAQAVAHYRDCLRDEPDSVEVLNNLAWILATHPAAALRNGEDAVSLARHACELTENSQTQLLGTLAAAYAEAGKFDEAKLTAQKAIALAEANQEKPLAEKNRELLRLYESGRAYRTAE